MTIESKITDEDSKAIKEIRKRLIDSTERDLLQDDNYIQRFLRAQNGNIDDAEAMLRKNLEFRKKNDVRNILKNFKKSEVLEKYVKFYTIGFDKEGCPVRYADVGKTDVAGILSSITREDVQKYMIYELEAETGVLNKQTEKLGKNVEKCVYIFDMENFSFAKATDKRILQAALIMFTTLLNNYPERLKQSYVVNAPVIFNIFYAVVKAVLPAQILSKIFIASDDSYKEHILKVIDADVLPKFLGGNKTDPDGNPLCLSIIKPVAEKVPEKYYISKNRQPLSKVKGIKKVTLANAAFHEDFLEVKDAGSYLEWEFETKSRDIGFGVFYQEIVDGEEKISELVPIQRIDTHEYPETGTYMCETAGTYVIVFDNTYSWVRSKEIYFRTKVVTSKEQKAEIEN